MSVGEHVDVARQTEREAFVLRSLPGTHRKCSPGSPLPSRPVPHFPRAV